MNLSTFLKQFVIEKFGDQALATLERRKTLWADYGCLYALQGQGKKLVLKHYQWPEEDSIQDEAQRFAVARKRSSFRNELIWYRDMPMAQQAGIPLAYGFEENNREIIIVLDDLESMGFVCNPQPLRSHHVKACLEFLVDFHIRNLNVNEAHKGGYWHLETRPFEFDKMEGGFFKDNAQTWDQTIKNAQFKTIIHGDAKPANYALNNDNNVIAYDFQYWGQGIGTQDLVCYLYSICENQKDWTSYTNLYFDLLQQQMEFFEVEGGKEIVKEWKAMVEVCKNDYQRFLLGWNPDHYKVSRY
ncbi:phosphotransferase [Luteibaculum oceani]|uniref:Aminoglycoside phosphotransferase domain-containing protein n=1 Tax=Luteibaculum oceani TaxID=1294296 RepID=A0A5C6VIE8_9FLAO|nr:hypothetical protein [Luteibaculum oceani]TXC85133.1 hypothetical protein FRX97_00485 [Luteibaculum oceani]